MKRFLLLSLCALLLFAAFRGSVSAQAGDSIPTYYGTVGPILQTHCVGCHSEGGIAPFPLDDPQWAVRMAPAMATAVQSGRMPPWPPGGDTPPLQGDRRLSAETIRTLVRWAEAGAPLGRLRYLPLPSSDTGAAALPYRLQPAQAYTPDAKLSDDYRCFLIDPAMGSDTFVTGYRIRPGQPRLVHHVILFVIGREQLALAQSRDGRDGRPGWPCFGGPGLSGNPADIGAPLGFWVPGTQGTDFPPGTGFLMRSGSRIVMQVHYNLAAGPAAPDQTRLELATAPGSAGLKPLLGNAVIAPVEIRCPPGATGESCTREYALAHTGMRFVAEGSHLLCNTSPALYQARDIGDGSSQTTTCDRPVPGDRVLLGVTAHMHLRGVRVKLELNPGTPRARTLLEIPRWDFRWQGQYWFQEPIRANRGDTVRITCVYDNSGPIPGPGGEPLEPRYMVWGEGTTDEMCLGFLSWVRP